MKTFKYIYIVITSFMMGIFLLTCTKEDDKTTSSDYEVTFSINVSNQGTSSIFKSAMDYNLADAEKIVLTILNGDGSPTKYTSYKVAIQQMNGIYFTQKLMLKPGNYKITEFLVLDDTDSTIFTTPLTGSLESVNISNPLPIGFSVAKDNTTHVVLEVVSTKYKKPEDFGLTHFPIKEEKTFSFLVGVVDREISKGLSAKLIVSNGAYSYTQNLDSTLTNVVTVKDSLNNYTLTIEKEGYETYSHAYTLDSIKMFIDTTGNSPLLIELEKTDKPAISDCDGNVYHSVTIGTQEWMIENLKTTKYNDCTSIPLLTNYDDRTPGYSWCKNDETYKNPYGALYNWYAVNTGKLCPIGWHVPSNDEWYILINYLGGWSVAGGKLKESGTVLWRSPNTGATNETGFTALPNDAGSYGFWWSSTVDYQVYDFMVGDIKDDAKYIFMEFGFTTVKSNFEEYYGHMYKRFSVRCVKD